MRLMDKIRGDSHERELRERDVLQRETERQAREMEERRRDERERERSRMGAAELVDRPAARAMPDGHMPARPMPARAAHPVQDPVPQPPQRAAQAPAGKLRDADVQDAVEVARRDAAADGRAVDRHGDAHPADPARTGDARAAHGTGAGQPHADARHDEHALAPLFTADVAQGFRTRWDATQIGFVDSPRQAVQQADELVAEVMTSLAQNFADERRQLEAQIKDGASTENLRVALQRYRSFFQRLLSL